MKRDQAKRNQKRGQLKVGDDIDDYIGDLGNGI